jgi:hypothetical protein
MYSFMFLVAKQEYFDFLLCGDDDFPIGDEHWDRVAPGLSI